MSNNEKKIMEMKQFIDRSGVLKSGQFSVSSKDLLALGEFAKQDLYGAIFLAIAYGVTCSHQVAEARC